MSLFQKPYDFIAIGDIGIDAFIKLKDAHVTCKLNNEDCEICMKFGDKIPFEFDQGDRRRRQCGKCFSDRGAARPFISTRRQYRKGRTRQGMQASSLYRAKSRRIILSSKKTRKRIIITFYGTEQKELFWSSMKVSPIPCRQK